MRNVFDQYTQPENRVTHALMTALDQDRFLLAQFLKELVQAKPPCSPQHLKISVQKLPGASVPEETSEENIESNGIPDAWIHNGDDWCVFIETKVTAKFESAQIARHFRTAASQEFKSVIAAAILPKKLEREFNNLRILEWKDVYAWLCRHGKQSSWANHASRYLEIAETDLLERNLLNDGTLTMFTGIPFDRSEPFDYLNGKRLLSLATQKLKGRKDLQSKLGVDANCDGRGRISGTLESSVWDYLSLWPKYLQGIFTEFPHLTLSIGRESADAMLTIPNNAKPAIVKRLKQLSNEEFQNVAAEMLDLWSPLFDLEPNCVPWVRGLQRRGSGPYKTDIVDAKIECDFRTAFAKNEDVKQQPIWLNAALQGLRVKKGNYEIQFGVKFPYDRCENLKTQKAIDLFASAWLGCKPLINLMKN